ncbi:guanyl-specific ribonuclease C2 [Mycena amicta]|nr:guanyl-specific ribonuclease C2 [Mycena amicta]KAJ7053575.1 guanyl-specific ribonuclease C2 [Mycena amicta]
MFAIAALFLALVATTFASPLDIEPLALPSGDVTCGRNVYTVAQVSSATNAGFARRSSPIGSDSYPHQFFNDEGLRLFCSGSSWLEWPIIEGGTYSGGSPGADRVVFNTAGTYCAVITHTGASSTNGFVSCLND